MIKGFTRPRKEFEPYLRTQEAVGGSSQGLLWLHLLLSSVFLRKGIWVRMVEVRAVVTWCAVEMTSPDMFRG